MEYTRIANYNVSKLILGTVALGMDYGISNTTGKPDYQHSFAVLSSARDAGVNTLDTARTYGAAEQTIGDYLEKNSFQDSINVISKFKISKENLNSYDSARNEAFESIRYSLKKLKISRMPFCLLHMSRELDEQLVRKHVPLVFKDLIAEELVDVGGISVDHPREVEWFESEPVISTFQVPMNIFDHRLLNSDILSRIRRKGKTIFGRSVFLQGLFFLDPGQLRGNLTAAKPYLLQLHSLAAKEGLTVAQLAFSYIRHIKPVSSIVFGAENVSQVSENIKLMSFPELNECVRCEIKNLFSNVPEDIITPGNWII